MASSERSPVRNIGYAGGTRTMVVCVFVVAPHGVSCLTGVVPCAVVSC